MDWEKELNLKRDEKIIASWNANLEGSATYKDLKGTWRYPDQSRQRAFSYELPPEITFTGLSESKTSQVKHPGVLVLTNRNLVFVKKHAAFVRRGLEFYRVNKALQEKTNWIPLENVVSISMEGTWKPTVTILYTGNEDKFWLQGVGQKEFESFRQLILDCCRRRKEEVWEWKKEGPEGEIRRFDEWLRKNPTDAVTWYDKGQVLHRLDRFEEEVGCYDEALKIDSNNAQTWNAKGDALHALGRFEQSIKCYDEMLKIEPAWIFACYQKKRRRPT